MGRRKRDGGIAGTFVRGGRNRRAVQVKTGGYFWSEEAEEAFFDLLAASCNVRASAAAVGFTTFTVYRQRRLRPDFAAKWQAALEQGYARLEMAVLRAATDTLEGIAFDCDQPIPAMTFAEAANLLKLHGAEVRGDRAGRPGRFAVPRDIEYYRESILRKIEAIRRMPGGEEAGEDRRCRLCGRDGDHGQPGGGSENKVAVSDGAAEGCGDAVAQ